MQCGTPTQRWPRVYQTRMPNPEANTYEPAASSGARGPVVSRHLPTGFRRRHTTEHYYGIVAHPPSPSGPAAVAFTGNVRQTLPRHLILTKMQHPPRQDPLLECPSSRLQRRPFPISLRVRSHGWHYKMGRCISALGGRGSKNSLSRDLYTAELLPLVLAGQTGSAVVLCVGGDGENCTFVHVLHLGGLLFPVRF